MKDGQPVKRGCWAANTPPRGGSRRRWGSRAPELFPSFFNRGTPLRGALCRSSREAPSGLLRLAPAGPRVVCGAGERGESAAAEQVSCSVLQQILLEDDLPATRQQVVFGAPILSFGASASESVGGHCQPTSSPL